MGYIVFEYCPHDDLFTYVKCGLTRENELLCKILFQQILIGVNYMHKFCKTAHLDLKLENVVLDKSFNAVLIDFAYSDQVGSDLTVFRGTICYTAPEIFSMKECQDRQQASSPMNP